MLTVLTTSGFSGLFSCAPDVDCKKGGTGMTLASPRVRLALIALASLLAAALMGGAGWGP